MRGELFSVIDGVATDRHLHAEILGEDFSDFPAKTTKAWEEDEHPRDKDGKFSESPGTGFEQLKERVQAPPSKEDKLWEERRQSLQARVDGYSAELGWPKRIIVAPHGTAYDFVVNGVPMTAAAVYAPNADEIVVFTDKTHNMVDLKGLLAHEIQHARWQRAWRQYEIEKSQMASDPEAQDNIGVGGSSGGAGALSTKFKERYPTVNLLQKFDNPYSRSQLAKQDGVSAYSTQYWKEYEKAKVGQSKYESDHAFKNAANETLAEIARLRNYYGKLLPGGPTTYPTDKPLMRRLFHAVNEGYKKYASRYGVGTNPGLVYT